MTDDEKAVLVDKLLQRAGERRAEAFNWEIAATHGGGSPTDALTMASYAHVIAGILETSADKLIRSLAEKNEKTGTRAA